jgi:glucosyl-3-phosphoglycerate synthase
MLSVLTCYVRLAEDTVSRYYADARINGLIFDRHEEETAVETFSRALKIASEEFFADPLGTPLLPNWNRVSAALPGFLGALWDAVEADNVPLAGSQPMLATSQSA